MDWCHSCALRYTHLSAVAKSTAVSRLGGAVKQAMMEHGKCHLRAIGPEATNQAVKAVAAARVFLAQPRGDKEAEGPEGMISKVEPGVLIVHGGANGLRDSGQAPNSCLVGGWVTGYGGLGIGLFGEEEARGGG